MLATSPVLDTAATGGVVAQTNKLQPYKIEVLCLRALISIENTNHSLRVA